MSILNPQTPPAPTPCTVAGSLKARARITFDMLVRSFNEGAIAFWNNQHATPEAIAECLGADGKELFELHAKIGQLLASVKPESVAPGAAVIGAVTYNEDGTVSVAAAPPAESSSSAG